MDPYSIRLIIFFVILLFCSGFFSAAEAAFLAANKTRLKSLAQDGNRKAELILKMVDKYEGFISTVLIGNNIVNILASSIAAVFFVGYFGPVGITISTAVTTVLILLFGELSPKIVAKEMPERYAMFASHPMRFLMFVFTPLNFLFACWKKVLVKVFRIHEDNTVTEAELLTFVGEVRQVGGINEAEEDMIRSAIEFDDLAANDILTPRVDITAVSIDDTIESIEQCFYETGYSRLPVYRDSIDNIIGIILLKDFFYNVIKEHHPLESVIKPVIFINETIKITRLLKKLQTKKTHFAVVVDEFGGTLGIVTMEDIVEELVGEIWDEHDEAMENIVKNADGNYIILGGTPLKDFIEALELDEKEIEINASTAGGWVIEHMGEIPREGQQFVFKNYTITILKTHRNRVMELAAVPAREADTSAETV